jgi:ketosteroid isomerase-like protein
MSSESPTTMGLTLLLAAATVLQVDANRCAALAARDGGRFFSLLSEDAAFFPEGMPVAKGKTAVRTLLAPFFDPKGPTMSCQPATVEVSRSADLAYVTGTYDEQGTAAARSPTRGHGKYVTIWSKSGRAWKLVVHIGNAEPPPERDFGPPPQP